MIKAFGQKLRPDSYLVRLAEKEGDPYPLKVVVEFHDEQTAEIEGVDKPMKASQARELIRWIRANGGKRVIYKRNGVMREFSKRRETKEALE